MRYIRHGVNNGGKDDWRTPFQLLRELDNEFDFTVDAAADADNAVCDRYWDAEADALIQSWEGERVFCNPPFSMTADFLTKAGEADLSIFVIAARTQATYFLSGVFANPHCHEIRFLHRGVKFIHPARLESVRSPLPICVVVFRKEHCAGDKRVTVACADSGKELCTVAGRKPGKPSTHTFSIKDKVIQDFRRGIKVGELVERHKVSRATIYRWVR